MTKFLIIALLLLPLTSYSNCNEVFKTKMNDMNLGKSYKDTKCGVVKEKSDSKSRVSLSAVKGKNDLGPTLSFYTNENGDVKITQLLSKDKITKNRHKYTYNYSKDCSEIKSVKYQIGSLQTEVNKEKCSDLENAFSEQELVYLSVNKLCTKFDIFFEVSKLNSSSSIPNIKIKEE